MDKKDFFSRHALKTAVYKDDGEEIKYRELSVGEKDEFGKRYKEKGPALASAYVIAMCFEPFDETDIPSLVNMGSIVHRMAEAVLKLSGHGDEGDDRKNS